MTLKECYARMNGNYEDAKLRLMMDSMVERFMFKFLEDDTMANLRSAVAEGNIPDSFRAAHTLKGVAANLAFTELQAKASALTEQLRPQTAQARRHMRWWSIPSMPIRRKNNRVSRP